MQCFGLVALAWSFCEWTKESKWCRVSRGKMLLDLAGRCHGVKVKPCLECVRNICVRCKRLK